MESTAVPHAPHRARRVLHALVALALPVLAVVLAPSGAQAQPAPEGTVKAQHGDWQVVCKPPATGSGKEVCALVQSVTAEDRSNVGLTIYFQKFSNGTRVLRVFAPLGVLLPPGLGLKIDAEDKLVEQLKTGKTAIFIIFQTEEAGIGIPISLKGFSEALPAID